MTGGAEEQGSQEAVTVETEAPEAPGLADFVADTPAASPVPLDPKFRAIAAAIIAIRDSEPVPPPMPPKRHWQR